MIEERIKINVKGKRSIAILEMDISIVTTHQFVIL